MFRSLMVVVLVISLLMNFYFLGSGASSSADSYVEQVLQAGASDQKIAVVPIEGPIVDATAEQVCAWLDAIERDDDYKALVIEVDTPGGTITPSDRIHDRIARLKASRRIPVIVTMGGMATSGGYYVACGADRIFAQPTTMTGSIGVLAMRYNLAELGKKIGVTETTITSPPGSMKNAGSMLKPEDPKEREYFQGLVDAAYNRFTSVVTSSRGMLLKVPISQVADGRAFTAEQSLAFGLIDEIGYPEAAYTYAARNAGLSKPKVVRLHRQATLRDLLMARSNLPEITGQPGMNLNVRIDSAMLHELTSAKIMYLWKGQ